MPNSAARSTGKVFDRAADVLLETEREVLDCSVLRNEKGGGIVFS